MRKQRVILEHHAHLALLRRHPVPGAADDRVVDQDLAARDLLEAGDAAQQGRLAATRGPSRQAILPCSRRKSTPFTMVWRP
jgi:hypothetical protein